MIYLPNTSLPNAYHKYPMKWKVGIVLILNQLQHVTMKWNDVMQI